MNKALPVIAIALLLIGCNSNLTDRNTLDIIQGSGPYWNQNVSAILAKCKYESSVLTIVNYEATGRVWNEEKVQEVQRLLMSQCVQYYRISV